MKPKLIKNIFLIVLLSLLVLLLAVGITAATSLAGGNVQVISVLLTVFLILIEVLAIGLLVFFVVLFFKRRELIWEEMEVFQEVDENVEVKRDEEFIKEQQFEEKITKSDSK
ncbi:MAG: hypothetical protein WC278_04640 [Bacilli bacterium]|jgi:predicted tellurium resistance membrane protein TerC|nr:hypothetical protein [Bacilli bacterium]MDD2682101.1 hypothetical protein [Bacilli bacterium]MDD3121445.1 hypothetical protein [Bacilli bacterium]MDD4063490.1 hypothetical protein [Bacilli bacterium]MDD4481984.1 hypothetical protein [Bacilli bacterium]